jgi:hypothetical protein
MKNIYTLAVAALLGAATLQSCADDPVDPPSDGATQISFTNNAEARFTYHRLDTAAASLNQPMEEGKDSVAQKTLSVTHVLNGKSNVVVRENHYLGMNTRDTTYLAQDGNGDLYINNFALDLVNGPEAQAILNQRVETKWVLAAKMSAASGTSWTAIDTAITFVNLPFPAPVTVKDIATANGNATVTVNGQQVTAKKYTHAVTATLGGSQVASADIEVYVSAAHGGIVKQVRKVATYTLPLQAPQKGPGAKLEIVTYTK